jgi:hypothetical protein
MSVFAISKIFQASFYSMLFDILNALIYIQFFLCPKSIFEDASHELCCQVLLIRTDGRQHIS